MPPPHSATYLTEADRDVIISFLNENLVWLDRECLEYSRLTGVLDLRVLGQYEYFKNYRSAVRHLIQIANSRGARRSTRK